MEWYTAAERFTEALATSDATPGGGAAAAMAGAMGCALALMAAKTTLKRKNTPAEIRTRLDPAVKRLGALKTELKTYIHKDSEAYSAYLAAAKLPKEDPRRPQALEDALWFAASVPADCAKTSMHCLQEIDKIKENIAPVILSDIYCAQHLLKSSIKCSVENIQANLVFIQNKDHIAKLEKLVAGLKKSY